MQGVKNRISRRHADLADSNPYASRVVTLELLPNPASHVHVHEVVLTGRPYLANWFKTYARQVNHEVILPMSGWSDTVAQGVVHWLYTGTLRFKADMGGRAGDATCMHNLFTKLADLYLGANRYKVDDLADFYLRKARYDVAL